jgi:hypothetical protein
VTLLRSPEQAFNFYNEIISRFDEATKAYGLEKIKAVNSVYMVGAGFPRKIEYTLCFSLSLLPLIMN